MRFLHTADWKIGTPARHAGVRAEAVWAERLRTVERIVEVANRERTTPPRIADDGVRLEDVTPVAGDALTRAIASAQAMLDDTARPGSHCGFCLSAVDLSSLASTVIPATTPSWKAE